MRGMGQASFFFDAQLTEIPKNYTPRLVWSSPFICALEFTGAHGAMLDFSYLPLYLGYKTVKSRSKKFDSLRSCSLCPAGQKG
jgi:hypothetical protein